VRGHVGMHGYVKYGVDFPEVVAVVAELTVVVVVVVAVMNARRRWQKDKGQLSGSVDQTLRIAYSLDE